MSRAAESTIPNQNEINFTGSIWYTPVQLTPSKKNIRSPVHGRYVLLDNVNDWIGIGISALLNLGIDRRSLI